MAAISRNALTNVIFFHECLYHQKNKKYNFRKICPQYDNFRKFISLIPIRALLFVIIKADLRLIGVRA